MSNFAGCSVSLKSIPTVTVLELPAVSCITLDVSFILIPAWSFMEPMAVCGGGGGGGRRGGGGRSGEGRIEVHMTHMILCYTEFKAEYSRPSLIRPRCDRA